MNKEILHREVQEYINRNLKTELSRVVLKGSPFNGVTSRELAEQIEAKNRCENKLPTWFSSPNIYYPNKLSIEQASSEITAKYKSELVSGTTLIDLTAGIGIDAFYFAQRFQQVIACEQNEQLAAITRYNYGQFNANIEVISADGLTFLKNHKQSFDCIYIDPSRRHDHKGKVFLLTDCQPNVPENLDFFFQYTDVLLLKVSPMLDITSARKDLKYLKEIHVVAVDNEVKELLFLLKKGFKAEINITTVNISKSKMSSFGAVLGADVAANFSQPMTYIYEPNAAILKAGLFNEVSDQLNLFKLHINSHLYTSKKLIEFPGRTFSVKQQIGYDTKQLRRVLPTGKANITTRNFPETVAQIRQKTKIKDGGECYLFFTTDINNKHIVLICEKV